MNILHMKYAVEVARLGSLNRAADALLIAQPNISRSIKELEADLGITIFNRSSRGMALTPEGEEFIGYAKDILSQIDRVEHYYRGGAVVRPRFSIAVPPAAYLTAAITRFTCTPEALGADITFRYATAQKTLDLLRSGECTLGAIRCTEAQTDAVKTLLEECGLACEPIAEFELLLLVGADSPLAQYDAIPSALLADYIEVTPLQDDLLPLPTSRAPRVEYVVSEHRIRADGRENRYGLLAANPHTYLWASPASPDTLSRHGLCGRPCADLRRPFRDLLVYREDYRLTAADTAFITAISAARREHLAAN